MKNETPILTKARRDAFAEREQSFRKWYHWKPVNGNGAICPRRVAGLRCLFNVDSFSEPMRYCICHHGNVGSGLWDHCAIWKDEHGNLVFTSEPYHMNCASLAELVKQLTPLGLEATILPRSGWYPDHTILLVITKSDVHEIKRSFNGRFAK